MIALKIPQKYSIPNNQRANPLARKIGIKFNGKIRPLGVVAYDVAEGWILTRNNPEKLLGIVEPFWR